MGCDKPGIYSFLLYINDVEEVITSNILKFVVSIKRFRRKKLRKFEIGRTYKRKLIKLSRRLKNGRCYSILRDV